MKKEIKLLDMIRYAKFGPIRLGDSRDKVQKFLGEPDKVIIPRLKKEKLEVIAYQNFQFTFLKDSLSMFMNKSFLKINGSPAADLLHENPWFQLRSWSNNPSEDLKLGNIRQHLQSNSISFSEKPICDCLCLMLNNDVELQFFSPSIQGNNPAQWNTGQHNELGLMLGAIYCYPRRQSANSKAKWPMRIWG